MNKTISASRQYIAICIKVKRIDSASGWEYSGHYLRKFKLPNEHENDSDKACWYFMQRLDAVAYVEGVIAIEDLQTIDDVDTGEKMKIQNLITLFQEQQNITTESIPACEISRQEGRLVIQCNVCGNHGLKVRINPKKMFADDSPFNNYYLLLSHGKPRCRGSGTYPITYSEG